MFDNRLAEETVYVQLQNQNEIEMAKKMNWITKYANDNSTIWEYDKEKKQNHKVSKSNSMSIRYFRYMSQVPIDAFKQLDRHFEYSIIAGALNEFAEQQYARARVPTELSNCKTVMNLDQLLNRNVSEAAKSKLSGTAKLKQLLAPTSEFCVFEGPKDSVNYWRHFRIIAEDYTFVTFYQIFNETKYEKGRLNNVVTCYDLDYDFQVSLKDNSDYRKLDEFLLYRFIFRNTIRLNEALWNAARKQRQPLLVYLRNPHFNQYTRKRTYVKHDTSKNRTLHEDFVGQKDVIDFVLHKSYQQLIVM